MARARRRPYDRAGASQDSETEASGYSIRRPLIARAITSCWICSVPLEDVVDLPKASVAVQQVPDRGFGLLESTESLPVRPELEEEVEEARWREGARMARHRAKSARHRGSVSVSRSVPRAPR